LSPSAVPADAPHALRLPQAVAARLWRWLEGARAKDKTLKRIFVAQKTILTSF